MSKYLIIKLVTPKILKKYGFVYKNNGDYRLYIPCYKYKNKTVIYAYLYINLDENVYTCEVKSNGTTYYPFYIQSNSRVNTVIEENLSEEIKKLIKKGILKYEN